MTETLTRPSRPTWDQSGTDSAPAALGATRSVSIYDAKTHLSRLVTEVESGGAITITRHGKPVATLQVFRPRSLERRPGRWAGQHWGVDVDWFEWSEQDEKDWYGQ